MDGDIPGCYFRLAIGNGYDCLLVDDAGRHDSGLLDFISDELDTHQMGNQEPSCNVERTRRGIEGVACRISRHYSLQEEISNNSYFPQTLIYFIINRVLI